MNRRALLGSLGVPLTSSLGGCLEAVSPPDTSTELGYLGIENFDTEASHEFDVRVERDGSEIHTSSHTVEATSGSTLGAVVVDCTWGPVAEAYVISVRVDGGEWTEQPMAALFDTVPECVTATIRYGRLGSGDPLVAASTNCDQLRRVNLGCWAESTTQPSTTSP
jgi:hypothetical protein